MALNTSLRDQIFFYIRENSGSCRTEVRDALRLQNNVSGPAIKELIDKGMVIEGAEKISITTNKPGKSLYVAAEWNDILDAQNKLFDQ
jgi:predicted transcriptional regulator